MIVIVFEEAALAMTLNGPYQQRVILLTARELEPNDIYELTKKELRIDSHGGWPGELARVTSQIYFTASPVTGSTSST